MNLTYEELLERTKTGYYDNKLDSESVSHKQYMKDLMVRRNQFAEDVSKALNLELPAANHLLLIAWKWLEKHQYSVNYRTKKLEFVKRIVDEIGYRPYKNNKSYVYRNKEAVQNRLEELSAALRLAGGLCSPEDLAQRPLGEVLDTIFPNGVNLIVEYKGIPIK